MASNSHSKDNDNDDDDNDNDNDNDNELDTTLSPPLAIVDDVVATTDNIDNTIDDEINDKNKNNKETLIAAVAIVGGTLFSIWFLIFELKSVKLL